jgi:hypothetical protein
MFPGSALRRTAGVRFRPPARLASGAIVDARIDISPYEFAATQRLEAALGCSHVLAQVLVRRGLGEPVVARAVLAAD